MYIAIDIGGTNVRIAGSKSLDDIVFEKIEKFELVHDFEKDFQKIIKAIELMSGGKVEATGIGTPGTYDEQRKVLTSVRNLPEWVGKPFVETLSKKFDCPVYADNDAVVGSLCDAVFGLGKNSNFIYITWGTGVGGAQVKYEDGLNYSEKIPWQTYLKEVNEKCGGKDMSVKFGKSANNLTNEEWNIVMQDLEFYLGDISFRLNEKRIIIGGGVASKQKERLGEIISNLKEKGIEMSISEFDDEVGLYGALALIKSKINQ